MGLKIQIAFDWQMQRTTDRCECNAHAERFVRSIKEECLARVVPLGEWHLRRLVREFVAHYHAGCSHQGIGNALIDRPPPQLAAGAIRRRQRVGGVLSYYYRAA